jgi:hypothetical protein
MVECGADHGRREAGNGMLLVKGIVNCWPLGHSMKGSFGEFENSPYQDEVLIFI